MCGEGVTVSQDGASKLASTTGAKAALSSLEAPLGPIRVITPGGALTFGRVSTTPCKER